MFPGPLKAINTPRLNKHLSTNILEKTFLCHRKNVWGHIHVASTSMPQNVVPEHRINEAKIKDRWSLLPFYSVMYKIFVL